MGCVPVLKYVDVGTAPGSFSCNRTLNSESASDKLIGAARIIEAAEASLPVSIYGMMVVPCTFVSRQRYAQNLVIRSSAN